jgi:hypothetical protein
MVRSGGSVTSGFLVQGNPAHRFKSAPSIPIGSV